MKYLHGKDILHLDLKPANILLDDCWRARIADFGMSKVIAAEKSSEFLSFISKAVGGTPIYMAPEVLTGSTPTASADVYSFGVMAWEVFNEQQPYTSAEKKDMPTLKHHVVEKKRTSSSTHQNTK